MKVILAGYSKTGTKTMHAAMLELGYSVYDVIEHFWHHGREWEVILTGGEVPSDIFKRMYEDVDVIVDCPSYLFWEEISKAFPEAKIILTTRDEDKFYDSERRQAKACRDNFFYVLMQVLSPTGWKFFQYNRNTIMALFGIYMKHQFDYSYGNNEMVVRRVFRQHQAYCAQNAPKDRLLIYQVKEGWEPLCKFLGKDIPNKPFPHENVSGNILDKLMDQHPAMKRMKRETIASLAILFGLGAYGVYKLCKSDFASSLLQRFSKIYN